MSLPLVSVANVERLILLVRGRRVMLDADLATLYGLPTKVLIQAVKRNLERFPPDFMIQLTPAEFENLRSQFATSSQWGGRALGQSAERDRQDTQAKGPLHPSDQE